MSPLRFLVILVGLSLLAASPGDSASRDGTVRFEGTRAQDGPIERIESRILRLDSRAARAFVTRTALHVFVADGREVWDDGVAPLLADALAEGPGAIARLPAQLPASVAVAGPNIDGAVVEFALPGGRGDGLVAIQLPLLLDRGKSDRALLDSPWPNKGLYVSGVDVAEDPDADLVGVYVPGRPKTLSRGAPPAVSARELPRQGRGDLVIFRGKGGSGDDASSLRQGLQGFLGASRILGDRLRTFPKGDDELTRELKSFRVPTRTLEVERSWYRGLALDPRDWEFSEGRVVHPVHYVAFSAPVVVQDADGTESTLIVGGVALYAPLLLTARQAPLYVGSDPRGFYEAVHAGEVPFLRQGDAVFFHRAVLDRWKKGIWKVGSGKTYGTKGTVKRVEQLARELKSKGLARAAGQPMPRRFQPAPDDAPEGSPPVRGRVYAGDLHQWLQHWDPKADLPGTEPPRSLAHAAGGARLRGGFGGAGEKSRPTGVKGLELVELYTLDPTCTSGQQVTGALSFVLDGVPDGEEAPILLQWSLNRDGRALVRFSAEIRREAGEHEIHVEAGCPSERGTATFEVTASWVDEGFEESLTTSVVSR